MKLNTQGQKIVDAINLGFSRMTPERWREERANQDEAGGEWFALEFAEAREATEGISWDFDGWRSTLECVSDGVLGGVNLEEEVL